MFLHQIDLRPSPYPAPTSHSEDHPSQSRQKSVSYGETEPESGKSESGLWELRPSRQWVQEEGLKIGQLSKTVPPDGETR